MISVRPFVVHREPEKHGAMAVRKKGCGMGIMVALILNFTLCERPAFGSEESNNIPFITREQGLIVAC